MSRNLPRRRRLAWRGPGRQDPALALGVLRRHTVREAERLTTRSSPEAEHPAVLVLTTACGVQAQPLGQVTDLPGPRWALRGSLGLTGTPQVVLRMRYATAVASTSRRDLAEVVG